MSEKILILEDDVLVACSLREVLSLVGYKVTGIAASVSDALCLAEKTQPDLAIVDVRLPGNRDGIEGAELLQQQFGMRVIFLTGEIDKAMALRAAKIDPAGYLMKPVHGYKLIELIRRALDETSTGQLAAEGT